MRKLISNLIISLDGVVEAPETFCRSDLDPDWDMQLPHVIAEQDAVLLGRKMYEEWSKFWPKSKMEPFATFINNTPKFIVSKSLQSVDWNQSSIISGDLCAEITALKSQPGESIGVHGSISLVQSLLNAGLIDELRLTVIPAIVGKGRRLLSRDGQPIQLNLESSQAFPGGMQYMVFRTTDP